MLGEVTKVLHDRRLGGAISAGAQPKDPPSCEPNEDGLLLYRLAGRVALLVLDGAGGFSVADAVLEAAERSLPAAPPAMPLHRAAATVWASLLAARGRAQAGSDGSGRRPHVAVTLAMIDADGSTWCATAGDTAVIAVDDGRVRLLSGVAPYLDHHAVLPQPQRVRLSGDTVLVGVTDGFFDALGPTWPSVLRDGVDGLSGGDAPTVAAYLVRAAVRAGGPDHVTAIVHQRSAG